MCKVPSIVQVLMCKVPSRRQASECTEYRFLQPVSLPAPCTCVHYQTLDLRWNIYITLHYITLHALWSLYHIKLWRRRGAPRISSCNSDICAAANLCLPLLPKRTFCEFVYCLSCRILFCFLVPGIVCNFAIPPFTQISLTIS